MPVSSPEALQLFHEGMVALADVEAAGVRIDMGRVLSTEKEIAAKIADVKAAMKKSEVFRLARRRFGDRANVMSYDQVSDVLYKDLGFKPTEFTASSYNPDGSLKRDAKASARRSALEKVDHPFVKDFDYAHKLEKTLSTYVSPLKYHAVEHGKNHYRVHPFYNLTSSIEDDDKGGAMTYRSSSDSPNFTNIPVRDPETADFCRRLYLPSPGDYHFGEPDYGQIEVRLAAVVTKDPALMREVTDPTTDMHRDTAAQAFCVSVDWMNRHAKEVKKTLRDSAKNQIVFPMFYGSTYFNCAPLIWERMLKQQWKMPGTKVREKVTDPETNKTIWVEREMTVVEHLQRKGITELGACRMGVEPVKGTFEYQIRKVENFLWERFKVYRQWKFDYYRQYLRDGGFRMLTGFWVWQHLSRRQVTNAPIQGCLAGSSRVLTSEGNIPIRELVGRRVTVWTGFKWASAVGLNRGSCRRAVVTLSSGLRVKCDTRHKFKNAVGEWVNFNDLKVGDYVALPKTGNEVPPSPHMTWEFFLGFVIGDGHLHKRKDGPDTCGRSVSIVGGELKLPELDRIAKYLQSEGYKVNRRIIPAAGNKKLKYEVAVESKKLAARLIASGMNFQWRSKTKRVPESVWRSNPQGQRDFLEGLWKSDGARADHQKGNIHTPNKRLLRDVLVLMGGLGFDGNICRTPQGHLLRVSRRRFRALSHRHYPAEAISRYVNKVDRENYDNQNDYIVDSRVVNKNAGAGQYTGERVLEKNCPGAEVYRFDRVTKITVCDYEETTYTMSVDDDLHQFVADGVIQKNTAFHCLLKALILLHRWLKKYRMRTKIVGEIHDSMQQDVHRRELQDVMHKTYKIMTEEVPRAWPWISVPLSVEWEVSPLGESWAKKRVYEPKNGVWEPKG